MKQRNFPKAIEALELVISLEPRCDPEVYVMLATCRLNLEQKEKALEICERGIEVHPNCTRLDRFYVSLLRASSAKSAMKAKLEQGLKQKPNCAIYMKGLGEILLEENPLNPQAGRMLRSAAGALPRDPEARYLYGQWACQNNQADLCIRELTRSLALTPANDQAKMQIYTLMATAQDTLDRPARAELAFRKALEFNQKLTSPNPVAAMEYADFLRKHSREGEAQELINRILTWAPSFAPAHLERAKFLAKQGKMEEAIAEGELALKHSGTDKTQLRADRAFLAKTYFALGRLEEAKLHQNWIESQ